MWKFHRKKTMIQELEDLKNSILAQRYEDALTLIYKLDSMSR